MTYPGASPASLSPPRRKQKGFEDERSYGRRCAGLCQNLSPVSCLGKMLSLHQYGARRKRSLTWQKRDTLFSPLHFPACGVGAWHERQRTFIIAADVSYAPCLRQGNCKGRPKPGCVPVGQWDSPKEEQESGAIWSLPLSAAVFYLTPVASDRVPATLKTICLRPKRRTGTWQPRSSPGKSPLGQGGLKNPELGGMAYGLPPKGWTELSSGTESRREDAPHNGADQRPRALRR